MSARRPRADISIFMGSPGKTIFRKHLNCDIDVS